MKRRTWLLGNVGSHHHIGLFVENLLCVGTELVSGTKKKLDTGPLIHRVEFYKADTYKRYQNNTEVGRALSVSGKQGRFSRGGCMKELFLLSPSQGGWLS